MSAVVLFLSGCNSSSDRMDSAGRGSSDAGIPDVAINAEIKPGSVKSKSTPKPAVSKTGTTESKSVPKNGAAGDYQALVVPFLQTHCVRCHGPAKEEGEFRIDKHLSADFADRIVKGKWGEVVNVLNSHEMPPSGEKQPKPEDVAKIVDWITQQAAAAELQRRDSAIVLRRLNREEYRNTIRDLIGVDFDPAAFPQDPPAGGFDNNGGALTLSPIHVELYFEAAREILDRALVEGDQPPKITWRFEPESGNNDSNRVNYDGQRAIVNGGNNPVDRGFKVMHHDSWDKHLNARDFAVKHTGEYVVTIRAGGRVPKRDAVVESARKFLEHRMNDQMKQNPKGEKYHREQMERDLVHFKTDRIYDYGSPRLMLVRDLGGQPKTIAEFDVDAPIESPKTYEIRTRFTTQRAGLTVHYAYELPRELENFWMQGHDNFSRPELWVDWFQLEGPVYDSWPPSTHKRILFDSPLAKKDERGYAKEVIRRFADRAYRRPATESEVAEKLALFDRVRPDASSFVEAIKSPLTAILVSPNFLYLSEPAPAAVAGDVKAGRPLNGYELASRLSYFLWSSMPDEDLTKLAASGKLTQNDALVSQIDRMLANPKSDAFVRNFAGQWLGLRDVGANPPAKDLYPKYDRHLEISIVEESRAFFAEILKNNLSVKNFLRSDFVTVNERLARFYGIPDVRGDQMRKVNVTKEIHRGGVLTQASILTTTSNGTRTAPVKRGVWVLKNLLGTDPGLPVANAGEIAPKVPGIDKATVRKRLEIHRELPQCARCHSKIDPLGFALENYNAAGEWRDREGFGYKGRIGSNDPLIDASSQLPDGTPIVGIEGLQEALLKQDGLFLRCLSEKMLTYALGRELGLADRPTVDAGIAHLRQKGDTLRELIRYTVLSAPFRSK